MSDSFRERFDRHKGAPPAPPLEVVTELLRSYVADNAPDETVRALEELGRAGTSPFLPRALEALESLLADPPSDEELIDLVEWQGGKVLEEPRGEAARAYLRELAEVVRRAVKR